MIPAIAALAEAIEELEVWCDYHEDKLPEEQLPSALVLAVDPRTNPNTTARMYGDVEALVQAMLVLASGNEPFRMALLNRLPEVMTLAQL